MPRQRAWQRLSTCIAAQQGPAWPGAAKAPKRTPRAPAVFESEAAYLEHQLEQAHADKCCHVYTAFTGAAVRGSAALARSAAVA